MFWYCKRHKSGREELDQRLNMLRQPFDLTIDFEKLCYSKIIEQSAFESLNKAPLIDIAFEPVLFVIP